MGAERLVGALVHEEQDGLRPAARDGLDCDESRSAETGGAPHIYLGVLTLLMEEGLEAAAIWFYDR